LYPPSQPRRADYLILESTYGDRLHEKADIVEELKAIVKQTCDAGGALIIPSFTVERAQELTLVLSRLKAAKEIPDIPIALDSPMGVDVTEVMERFPEWLRVGRDATELVRSQVTFVGSMEESVEMVRRTGPKIVIAGSGMVTGGRVLHYLKEHLGDSRSTVLLVGYQAVGTRGRSLQEGCHELRFFGEYYPVKARIAQITSLSAHADQREMLTWLKGFDTPPAHIFLNHGEPQPAETLLLKIRDVLPQTRCRIARMNAVYALADPGK
jgi:metallo-beta-lactamase family protein